jgi:hypothetical protein
LADALRIGGVEERGPLPGPVPFRLGVAEGGLGGFQVPAGPGLGGEQLLLPFELPFRGGVGGLPFAGIGQGAAQVRGIDQRQGLAGLHVLPEIRQQARDPAPHGAVHVRDPAVVEGQASGGSEKATHGAHLRDGQFQPCAPGLGGRKPYFTGGRDGLPRGRVPVPAGQAQGDEDHGEACAVHHFSSLPTACSSRNSPVQ